MAGLIASLPLALSTELFAGGEWPDGPNKHWFQGLKRPDNAKHPRLGERRRRDERRTCGKGPFSLVRSLFGTLLGHPRRDALKSLRYFRQ